jgi:hypothetical protein
MRALLGHGTKVALLMGVRHWRGEAKMLVLADFYRARSGSGFSAYMRLQHALLTRWVARGGTEEAWCERMAPVFRLRYGALIEADPDLLGWGQG